MSVPSHQDRTAVSHERGNSAFGGSRHRQQRREGMAQGVPGHAIQSQFFHLWQIHPPIEVPWINVRGRVLTGKYPHRAFAILLLFVRNGLRLSDCLDLHGLLVQFRQERFRFLVESHLLHITGLRGGQGNQTLLQIHLVSSQAKLFHLSHAGQDRQPDPPSMLDTESRAQRLLLLRREEPRLPCWFPKNFKTTHWIAEQPSITDRLIQYPSNPM